MSEFPNKKGKKRQTWTERAVRRAGRACPDRVIRICIDGTLELVPLGESTASEQRNPLDRILQNASHEDRTP